MDNRLLKVFEASEKENAIPDELYHLYGVKKGLRNEDGTGVLIGLTRIADVVGYQKDSQGHKINCEGELYYRGIPIENLVSSVQSEKDHYGYERIAFLILFGHLPNSEEMALFKDAISSEYELSEGFLTDNLLRKPTANVMNMVQRCLLMLYTQDPQGDDCSPENTLRQGLSILAKLPSIIAYAYQAKAHFIDNRSMVIHHVHKDYSIAENILSLIHTDGTFTDQQAQMLDLIMILHADHGSGNNSTFANLVVASTGTDLYSSFSASVGSLKGPRHGGANITCSHMMKQVIDSVGLDASDDKIEDTVHSLLNQQFFDHSGLIYGFGHAVYTLSDPRCELLKKQADLLAQDTDRRKLEFYRRFESAVVKIFREEKHTDICANVDFYSGFVYEMLGIPEDLYTPLFVTARSIGWLAHNIEDKLNCNRIIRPAGLYVGKKEERK